MKKTRIVLLCVTAVAFIISIAFVFTTAFYTGKDYSQAYAIHTEISTLSSPDEAAAYLTENKISYTLSNSSLSIDDYDITYTIQDGKLIPCEKLVELSRLDNENDKDLVVETYEDDGEYTKRVGLEKIFIEYYKTNDNYYIKLTGLFKFISIFFGVFAAVTVVQVFIPDTKELTAKNTSD